MSADQFDRIDQYLRGELSASDAKDFEASLASDPAMSEEFTMQKDIVEGIKAFRKQQLKHQLSQVAIPENSGWQSVGIKGLVGAAVTSAILVSAWYFGAETESTAETKMITMEGPAFQAKEFILPEITPVEEVTFEPVVSAPVVREVVATASSEVLETPTETKEFEVQLVLPEDQASTADAEFVPEQVTEEFRTSNLKPTTKALQVDNFDTESLDLRYEYFDGKLALYGNFGNSPYEILEINQNGEKRLFLYHEDAYYAITNTSKPLPMVRIEDSEMVEELELFKSGN